MPYPGEQPPNLVIASEFRCLLRGELYLVPNKSLKPQHPQDHQLQLVFYPTREVKHQENSIQPAKVIAWLVQYDVSQSFKVPRQSPKGHYLWRGLVWRVGLCVRWLCNPQRRCWHSEQNQVCKCSQQHPEHLQTGSPAVASQIRFKQPHCRSRNLTRKKRLSWGTREPGIIDAL